MVKIVHRETVALGHIPVGNLDIVQDGAGSDGDITDKEAYELEGVKAYILLLHLTGREDGETVVLSEIDDIAVGVHADAVEILLLCQAIAVDMADKCFVLHGVLPDARRSGAPDVAVVRLHDIADDLVTQLLATRETLGTARLTVVEVQSLLGADGDGAFQLTSVGQLPAAQLAHLVADDAVEQRIPALRAEIVGTGVIARHTVGGAHPDESLTIAGHRHNPVVAQPSASLVLFVEIQVAQRSRSRVIDTESA